MFKVCPSCGGEYQLRASECPECHVPLSLGSGDALPAPPVSPPTLPPAEELAPLQVETPWYLHELAEELQRHGISSRIDSHPPGAAPGGPATYRRAGHRGSATQLAIYVPHEDLEAARAVAHEFALARLPDAEAAGATVDASACPACGEPIADNAAACPGCGLEFPELESPS